MASCSLLECNLVCVDETREYLQVCGYIRRSLARHVFNFFRLFWSGWRCVGHQLPCQHRENNIIIRRILLLRREQRQEVRWWGAFPALPCPVPVPKLPAVLGPLSTNGLSRDKRRLERSCCRRWPFLTSVPRHHHEPDCALFTIESRLAYASFFAGTARGVARSFRKSCCCISCSQYKNYEFQVCIYCRKYLSQRSI